MIVWSAGRPLVWSDFRGPVDPDAPPRTAASTSSSLTLGYELEVRQDRRCTFVITSIETLATFEPSASWVKPGQRTAEVLEHEQGHFDITQVHKMIPDREARGLVGDERRCPSGAAMEAIQARAAAIVAEVRDRVWADLRDVQERYDAETAHGTQRAAQREWSARIEEALRRGRW
ncbi:MAG TPA: hypothetical protein VF329_11815 [Gammaproteobacteria bacterium]